MIYQKKIKTVIIVYFFAFLHIIALVRLFFLQIYGTYFFCKKSNQQCLCLTTSFPERAPIYDRTGKQKLAISKKSKSLFITPNNIIDKNMLLKFLNRYYPNQVKKLSEQMHTKFMFIKRHLTEEELEIYDKNVQIKDLYLLEETKRFYPLEGIGPILGIVDTDGKGIMGLELEYDTLLSGRQSLLSSERDGRMHHFYFRKNINIQGTQGNPLYLTIDANLQYLVYKELQKTVEYYQSTEGAVIIMDPSSGDILAMVNVPDFDPNQAIPKAFETTKNKILSDSYELGSVMKIFLAAAALSEGVTEPDTIIDCENCTHIIIDGMRVNTWKRDDKIKFSEVIENSNNIGTAKIAVKIGTQLYQHYQRWGFSQKTGIRFPGEQSGFITPYDTWSKQSFASLSYGYEMRTTLLQLATAFCTIANYGIPIKPRISFLEPICKKNTPIYSRKIMQQIRDILKKTITQGTGKKASINGYNIMGKTGTANLLVDGKYQKDKNIFTFVGIIEKNNYKRVIVTFIKESNKKNIYAATVTVPLFEKVAEIMLINDKIWK